MHFPSSVQILLRHPWRKFTQLFNPVYFWLRWHFYHSWCLSTKWIFQRLEHVEVKWGQICKNSRWCSSSKLHSEMVAMTMVNVCGHTLLWQSSVSLLCLAFFFDKLQEACSVVILSMNINSLLNISDTWLHIIVHYNLYHKCVLCLDVAIKKIVVLEFILYWQVRFGARCQSMCLHLFSLLKTEQRCFIW